MYQAVPSKALLPIFITPFPIVILINLRQPEKASSPMLVTLSGIVVFANLLQFLNV